MRCVKSRNVRHQRMVMSSRMRFVAEQQIHQTDLEMIQWCSCSRFLIAFGLSQEARKRKKFVLIAYNNWITICFLPGGTTLYRHLMKIKLTDMFRISCCWTVPKFRKIGARILQTWTKYSDLTWLCKWKTEFLILSLGGATCVINLFIIELTDAFTTK